uniref:Uncharacterized protein n=1 Tax=Anguilla anguilla TaxID=7936 RepID=A0A0E9V149_ANGAN
MYCCHILFTRKMQKWEV